MKPDKLASYMLSPSTRGSDLLISPFLFLPVTLTAQIDYWQPDNDSDGLLMRFSTDAGEAIWAGGRASEFVYRDLRKTLALRVHVSEGGLQPAALGVLEGAPWLGLRPVPEDIIDRLPGAVAGEIRLNLAGKFAS